MNTPDDSEEPPPARTALIGDTLYAFDAHGRPLRAETRARPSVFEAETSFTYQFDPHEDSCSSGDAEPPEPPEA